MNIFTQYGIKEVADVMIYSIIKIGDEEVYLPVLYLDTLKISNIEKKEQKVAASSGYGNARIMSWSFGKDITLKMQDALFTPASLSMCWGGQLDGKLAPEAMLIAKITIRNKYVNNHYSSYAYPSPEITCEEWEILYEANNQTSGPTKTDRDFYLKNLPNKEEQRTLMRKSYYRKESNSYDNFWTGAVSGYDNIIAYLLARIDKRKAIINSKIKETEYLDTVEECIADKNMDISYFEQQKAYMNYLSNNYSSSFTLLLDSKNMKPLYLSANVYFYGNPDPTFMIKEKTKYIKLSRKRYVTDNYLYSYGKTLIISPDTFPNYYRIVGETNIREQTTGQDKRLQFIIPKAKLSGDTNIKLEAAGEPTVFDMNVDVICPENDVMFILREFEVENDCNYGGTHIVPQDSGWKSTQISNHIDTSENVSDNNEIY